MLSRESLIMAAVSLVVFASMVCQTSFAHGAKEIRVGIPLFHPPFSFAVQGGHGARGFGVDLALLLVGALHGRISFVGADPAALKDALRKGNIDLISCLAMPKKDQHEFNLIETDIVVDRQYFVNTECVTVTCHKDLPGKTVAVVRGSDFLDVDLTRDDINFIQVDSPLEALKLVDSGQAEVYIAYSSLVAQYLIEKYQLENIKKVGLPIESVPLCVVVHKDNPILLTELSVAFGKILENKDYLTIRDKWLGRGFQVEFAFKYVKYLLIVLGLIISGVLMLLVWNRMLRRRVNVITHDLQISEKKYRHLFESSPEMIYLVAEDGTIKFCNENVPKSLGFSRDEIVLANICDLVAVNQRQQMADFVKRVFREGAFQTEFVFHCQDGKLINADTVVTVVKADDNTNNLACLFSRDITERKRLEEELVQSERLATMGRMAAGLAHEINNPLGILLANAQDALRGGLDRDGIHQCLEIIERNAQRAGKIIDKLLSFTRPSPLQRLPVELNGLIDEALFIMRQPLTRKRILVRKELPNTPVVFQGDSGQIQQVLVNLLLNSVEASDTQGSIAIRVRQDGTGTSERVYLEIEDSGIGIPESDLPKIFDPFFTARKKKGFGLGLFVSRRIVEEHGGTIQVSSNRGQGTLMRIAFPVQ